jgi:hypothetical protein
VVSVWVSFWVAVGALLPLGTTMLLVHLPAVLDRGEGLRDRLRPRRLPRADVEPVERIAADLHRLALHFDTIERSHEMHRAARLRAVSLAYDYVLLSACRTLEVEAPVSTPLRPVERLQTEAALAQHGLVW